MSKSSAPTLFQVNGPTGLKNWKDYCADLSDTKLRGELIDDSLALQSDGKDLGIDWVQESYGIIYNKELLEKAGYKAEDINSFDKLKACADDIQARKDELGVDGAFTSAGMDDSSSWRYTTHLANLPLYYEFEKEHNQEDDEIKGEYLDNFKQIFDLYITDSTCDPSQLASKTGDDATNEFATGKAVFYQNGSWAYADLTKAGMTDDQLGMLRSTSASTARRTRACAPAARTTGASAPRLPRMPRRPPRTSCIGASLLTPPPASSLTRWV